MRTSLRRGLQDIATRSSLAATAEDPQRQFLRVASLELKKTLCRKVRAAALKRAAEMERTIAELDGEKARILAAVGVPDPAEPRHIAGPLPKAEPGSEARHDFRLRY
jgi:hypothetical protein